MLEDATIIYFLGGSWLAALTYIWTRHVHEDERRLSELNKRMADQDTRVSDALSKIDDHLAELRRYQTEFNLQTARTLAEIKQALHSK